MARQDSKSDLGKGIAGDFDEEEDEEEDEEGASDENSDESEDDAGTSDEAGKGKPEGQKSEKKGEDDGGDSDSEPPLTRADLNKAVTEAVSGAVGKVNSSKDRELATLRKQGKETEETLRREIEDARVQGLPEADRAAMRQVQSNDRAQREIAADKEEAGDMLRLANAARLSAGQAKFGEHGATVTELEACNSPEAQESLCLQKERDYWSGVALGNISITDGTADASKNGKGKKGKSKDDAPAGSKKSTDVGRGGAAPPKGEEVTSLDSFAQSLVTSGAVPSGGITRVEEKTGK